MKTWPVWSDDHGNEPMGDLGRDDQRTMEVYRKLPEGLGQGMQAFQLETLCSEEFAYPKAWAAFIVSGDDTPMVFPEGEEPRVGEEQEALPKAEAQGGCYTTRASGRGAPMSSMLMGRLGLKVLRRRGR